MPHAARCRQARSSSGRRMVLGVGAMLVATALGCAPAPLVTRAIRARGGRLHALVTRADADVHVGFPGRWQARTVFEIPNHYAVTIYTTGPPNHYIHDGARTLAFIGDRRLAVDADPAAPLATLARFTAATLLDALLLPGVRVTAVPPTGDLAEEAVAVFADDGTRIHLGFDRRTLLVRAEGPVVLDPFGRGELVAAFSDFRRAEGRLLAGRTDYALGGTPIAALRAVALCPDPPGLSPAFDAPVALPDCASVDGG